MKRYGVRPSVRLFHSSAAAECGGFAAVGPKAADIDRLLHGAQQAAGRANAGSAT